jgi:NAD(P)H-flavin reductase
LYSKAGKDDFMWHSHLDNGDGDGPLTEDLIKKLVPSDVVMVWICGPSGFNKFVYDLLINVSVEKSKIIVM